MRKLDNRRKVERIKLYPPLPGNVGGVPVEVVEVSLSGARVRHQKPIAPHRTLQLAFGWADATLEIESEVMRCHVAQFGSTRTYESGLRFNLSHGTSIFSMYQLIAQHVEEALNAQVANASGNGHASLTDSQRGAIATLLPTPQERAVLRIHDYRDQGYTRYTLNQDHWTREETWEAQQPEEGFTIWAFEEDEQVDTLCRIYLKADSDLRSLIRLCAELSLYVDDDSLPPQSFEP